MLRAVELRVEAEPVEMPLERVDLAVGLGRARPSRGHGPERRVVEDRATGRLGGGRRRADLAPVPLEQDPGQGHPRDRLLDPALRVRVGAQVVRGHRAVDHPRAAAHGAPLRGPLREPVGDEPLQVLARGVLVQSRRRGELADRVLAAVLQQVQEVHTAAGREGACGRCAADGHGRGYASDASAEPDVPSGGTFVPADAARENRVGAVENLRGTSRPPLRLVLLAPAGLAMLAGLDGALMLLGVPAPVQLDRLAVVHGQLMVLGFVGTLVALERAVAVGRRLPSSPSCCSRRVGGTFEPGSGGRRDALHLGGAIALVGLYAWCGDDSRRERWPCRGPVHRRRGGRSALLAGVPIAAVAPWLVAFLVLTVVGERLELMRVAAPPRPSARGSSSPGSHCSWAPPSPC